MDEYNFLEAIKEKTAAKGKSISWLATELDVSQSWIYSIKSLEETRAGLIMHFSELLEFDFLEDYYRHLEKQLGKKLPQLNEPSQVYETKKKPQEITVQVSLTGSVSGLSDVMEVIVKEASKKGYTIG